MTGAPRSLLATAGVVLAVYAGFAELLGFRLASPSTSTMTPIPAAASTHSPKYSGWRPGWEQSARTAGSARAPVQAPARITAAYACGLSRSEGSPQSLGSLRAGAPLRLWGLWQWQAPFLSFLLSPEPPGRDRRSHNLRLSPGGCTGPCRERCPFSRRSQLPPPTRHLLPRSCFEHGTGTSGQAPWKPSGTRGRSGSSVGLARRPRRAETPARPPPGDWAVRASAVGPG